MKMNQKGIFLFAIFFVLTIATDSSARRSHITAEQKAKIQKIQTIYLNILALTENGRVPSDNLTKVVKPRLEALGYIVVTDRKTPHDVEFRVKCEERKRWAGTTRSGGDAELADAPARLWKGPACLFSYRLEGKDMGWYKEARTDFANADEAARQAKASDAGAYAISQLEIKLQDFDFPILITTEWNQLDRLLPLLDNPDTPTPRKLKVLHILKDHQSVDSMPHLLKMIKEEDYQVEATEALAGGGSKAIPILVDLFTNNPKSSVQAAAAKALGTIGAHTGDPSVTPPLLDYLNNSLQNMKTSEDIDFPVLTEVTWSIAKLRNEKSIKPIEELNRKIWLIYDNSPEMKELRDAANVATKMVDLDYQIM